VFEDIVIYDYQKARKTKMPDFVKSGWLATLQAQEKEKASAAARIQELTVRVTDLEKGTWDRTDAIEDLGSHGMQ
jgi:hypothetical protein